MKRVLFVIVNMEIGGTRTSLLNLLNYLKEEDDLVLDLMIISHKGVLMKSIPSSINVLAENKFLSACITPMNEETIFWRSIHLGISLLSKILGYRRVFPLLYKYAAKKIDRNGFCYDAIFGFQEGISDDFAMYIHGKKHYTWVHSNLEVWFNEKEFLNQTFQKAEKILFVANATRNRFVEKFRKFNEKSIVVQNTINSNDILKKINLQIAENRESKVFKLISVGRFNPEKAFHRIPIISKMLVDLNIPFEWYIVGSGSLFDEVQKQTKDLGLENYVFFLGEQSNPYKYMSKSDCLVVTSLSESQPMVILEALIIGIPIITTNFSSAVELIDNQQYGIICENTEEAEAEAIKDIILDDNRYRIMKKYAEDYSYDCQQIIKQVKNLL